jgi:hypothetical protein
MMLRCPALHRPRTTTLQTTEKIWNRRQRECYRRQSTQEKYMTLLGKQMDCGATMKQQRQLDSAMKNMLSDMNTIRTEQHQLQSLTGKTYSRPPEETAQMAELWQETRTEKRPRTANRRGRRGRIRERSGTRRRRRQRAGRRARRAGTRQRSERSRGGRQIGDTTDRKEPSQATTTSTPPEALKTLGSFTGKKQQARSKDQVRRGDRYARTTDRTRRKNHEIG